MRRQAIKLCVRKGFSFQSAWWSVYLDVEHRMEHAAVDHRELAPTLLPPLRRQQQSSSDLAPTPSASAAVPHNTEVAQLRQGNIQKLVDRLRQSKFRSFFSSSRQSFSLSWGPFVEFCWCFLKAGTLKCAVTLAQRWTTELALSNKPVGEPGNHGKKSFSKRKVKTDKGKGKKGGKKGQEPARSATARSSTGRKFDDILKDPTSRAFMTANHQNGKVCWHFQRGSCTRDCKKLHACARCGTANIGYDACQCQASRV